MAVTGQQIVAEVEKFLGDEYVLGAAGPTTFDCSGLVQYGLTKLGIKGVPRTSEAQWGWVQKIPRSQLQPGDLIFEQWPGDDTPPGHVVIYAGGGQVIEAPQPGQRVHKRSWSPNETTIVGYGRVPGVQGGGAGGGGPLAAAMSLALPGDILGMFGAAEQLLHGLMWFLNPENWARIIAGVIGVILAGFGIGFLVAAGK